MENKKFKMGDKVYVVASNLDVVQGEIVGARRFYTAFDNLLLLVETPIGTFERFSCDVFRSVEEIQQEIPNRVIG